MEHAKKEDFLKNGSLNVEICWFLAFLNIIERFFGNSYIKCFYKVLIEPGTFLFPYTVDQIMGFACMKTYTLMHIHMDTFVLAWKLFYTKYVTRKKGNLSVT